MILFTILLTTTLAVLIAAGIITLTGGVAVAIVFGDVIVCIAICVWIGKMLRRNRRKH